MSWFPLTRKDEVEDASFAKDLFLTDQTKFHLYIIIEFLKQLWFPLLSVFLIPSVNPIFRIQASSFGQNCQISVPK